MDELEELFRESFERHADEVDTTIALPTARPRNRRLLPLTAAAAAVAAIAAGAMVLRDGDTPNLDNPPVITVPSNWRVEQWHGVQVSVPPDWGWGGAPMRDDFGGRDSSELLACYESATVAADGTRAGAEEIPYVGRPVFLTDMCESFDPEHIPMPRAAYVWLGTPLEPGTDDLGGGWTQQSVKVAGETVTVATQDSDLRRQILGSARAADPDRCPPEVKGPRATGEPISDPTGADVCIYTANDDGVRQLTYSTEIRSERATRFLHAVDAAPHYACADTYSRQWALIRIHSQDRVQDVIAALDDCTLIATQDKAVELTEATVEPWAVAGIPATVQGPSLGDRWIYKYFIGPQG